MGKSEKRSKANKVIPHEETEIGASLKYVFTNTIGPDNEFSPADLILRNLYKTALEGDVSSIRLIIKMAEENMASPLPTKALIGCSGKAARTTRVEAPTVG